MLKTEISPSNEIKAGVKLSKSSDTEDWVSGAILLISGFVGLALLYDYLKPKCPACKKNVETNMTVCPHCGAYLYWRAS